MELNLSNNSLLGFLKKKKFFFLPIIQKIKKFKFYKNTFIEILECFNIKKNHKIYEKLEKIFLIIFIFNFLRLIFCKKIKISIYFFNFKI